MSDRFAWSVLLCAAGTWLGFANPLLHLPVLALVLPMSLAWLGLQARSLRQAFFRGWLAASAGYAAALYWVSIPVHEFGSLPWIAAVPCPILLGLYLGLYAGLFCLALAWAAPRTGWPVLILLAWTLWASLEYIREILLTGFPWLGLAQAFAPWPVFLQAVSVLGAHGFSGLLAGIGVGFVLGVHRPRAWIAPAAALCGLTLFGVWHIQHPALTQQSINLPAALIQGDIEQGLKWDPAFQRQTLNRYLRMSRNAVREHSAELVVWPETAIPFYVQENTELSAKLRSFCRNHQVALFTGAPGYSLRDGGTEVVSHNLVYLFGPDGLVRGTYTKEHLVPFGEYIPFGSYLPFITRMVQGVGDFRPGDRTAPLEYKDLALGGLICYEVIFSGLVQHRVAAGANLLINVSNDAWFGRSSGPRQHLHQAVLRSIEQGRGMLRATNTGVSAIIDPQGRILQSTTLFAPETLQADSLPAGHGRTFFSRHYHLLRTAFFLLAAIAMLWIRMHNPGKPQPDHTCGKHTQRHER